MRFVGGKLASYNKDQTGLPKPSDQNRNLTIGEEGNVTDSVVGSIAKSEFQQSRAIMTTSFLSDDTKLMQRLRRSITSTKATAILLKTAPATGIMERSSVRSGRVKTAQSSRLYRSKTQIRMPCASNNTTMLCELAWVQGPRCSQIDLPD